MERKFINWKGDSVINGVLAEGEIREVGMKYEI